MNLVREIYVPEVAVDLKFVTQQASLVLVVVVAICCRLYQRFATKLSKSISKTESSPAGGQEAVQANCRKADTEASVQCMARMAECDTSML